MQEHQLRTAIIAQEYLIPPGGVFRICKAWPETAYGGALAMPGSPGHASHFHPYPCGRCGQR